MNFLYVSSILLFAVLLLFCIYLYMRIRRPANKSAIDAMKYKKGIDLVNSKYHQEACTYFTQVLNRDPGSALALMYRGKCHLALGNWYEAIVDCNRASSYTHVSTEVYLNKGIALYKLKLFHEAFLEIDKAVCFARDNAASYRWRGVVRLKLGLPDEAAHDFQKAITMGDEHASYCMYMLQQGGSIDAIERMM